MSEIPPQEPAPTEIAEDRPIFSLESILRPAKPSPRVWPVFLTYGIVLVGSLILGVVLVIFAVAVHVAHNPEADRDPEALARAARALTGSPAFFVVSALVLYSALISLPLLAARIGGERASVRLRFTQGRTTRRVLLLAVLGLLGLSQLPESFFALMEWNPGGSIELMTRAIRASTGFTLGLLVFFGGPVAGFAEELFFRGFMQTRLQQRWGTWPAIIITAVAFGLLHLDPVHTPFAFSVGIFLGWITEFTGSIVPAIAAHGFNNTVWVLSVALFPGPWSSTVHGWLLGLALLVAFASIVLLRFAPSTAAGESTASSSADIG